MDQMSGTDTDTATEEKDDIRALLDAAFDEQEDPPQPESDQRPRRPDGKFAKVEASDPEAAPDPAEPTVEAAEEKPSTKPEEKAAAEPPPTWKAEAREQFKALPPEAQKILLDRHLEMEADYSRKTQDIAALRRDYEPVRAILQPYDQQIRTKGFTPASLIQAWSNVELALADPNRAHLVVRDLVNNYKIDKAVVARELGLSVTPRAGEAPPAPDGQSPIVLPPEVQRELQELRNGHNQLTSFLSTQEQRQRQEAENRVMGTIAAFKDAKDDKGTPLHPHYDELEDEMIALLVAERARGREPGLQELYDKAVWANTSTRERLLADRSAADEAQRKTAEKKVADEARAKAERARKAGSSVNGAPGSGQARIQQGRDGSRSIRDELTAALDDLAEG
jgi:hypothetical protein